MIKTMEFNQFQSVLTKNDFNPDVQRDMMSYYDERDCMDDMMDDSLDYSKYETPIQKFYKGQNILLTGGSGFIGTLVLEKLLRATDINKIFVLFRGNSKQDINTRVKEYFHNEVFDKMRSVNKEFYKKVTIVPAELQKDNLGLEHEDFNVLIKEVNVIFHVAATVRFDENLRTAYEINVKGTLTLLNMAKEMKHLKSFVYVSTAYCHFEHLNTRETMYDPVYTQTQYKDLIDACSYEELAIMNDLLITPKPNSYTLSKSTAENLVYSKMNELPICIVRPSVVMPTINEPLPLWFQGLNAHTALYSGVGMGLLRTILTDVNKTLDLVPGDLVVNQILAVGWNVGIENALNNVTYLKSLKNNAKIDTSINITSEKHNLDLFSDISKSIEDINEGVLTKTTPNEFNNHIYNIASGLDNPITTGDTSIYGSKYTQEESTELHVWAVHKTPTTNKTLYYIYFYLFNIIPTILLFQNLEKMYGKKPRLMKIYRKLFFLNSMVAEFSNTEWTFPNDNTKNLFQKLSKDDKELFNFKMDSFSWDAYHCSLHRSLALYGFKVRYSKKLYDTQLKYMIWVDNVFLMSMKILLYYVLFYLLKYFLTQVFY